MWSDVLSTGFWGVADNAPVDGDSVFVPKGTTLVVDKNTPKLNLLLVEGNLLFANSGDFVVEAVSIIIDEGIFRAGTIT